MTTEYKLLLNDVCTFTPIEKKEGDSAEIKRFQIIIKNPKNLMAYEIWNPNTPKANAGTAKIFGIVPSLLVECINNYNKELKDVDGFTYKPTAWAALGNIAERGKNSGGVLVIDEFLFGVDTKSPNEPIMTINTYTKSISALEGVVPFPEEPFTGNIRMNINSFQSTAMIGLLNNEFVEGWLKPTYNKINPYPYIPDNLLGDKEKVAYDRTEPKLSFLYSGKVSIKNISSGLSRITVANPLQALAYLIWDPNTPFTNKNSLPEGELVSLNSIYSIFSSSENKVTEKGLPQDEYAWRPVATFDLIDETGKGITYVGRIVNMESEFGEPNQSPKIMIDVDTRNFELYKNKRLSALPNGDFLMLMDIDSWDSFWHHVGDTIRSVVTSKVFEKTSLNLISDLA